VFWASARTDRLTREREAHMTTTTWTETEASANRAAASAPETPAKPKTSRAKILLPALIAVALAGGGAAYLVGRGTEATDDAQIEGHVVNVAARVGGQVARVVVKDNQLVEAGEVLVEIDDRDYAARLLGARADLASAEAGLAAARAQLALTERSVDASLSQAKGSLAQASSGWASTRASEQQAKADVAAAESRKALARLDLDRAEALRAKDTIAQAELDARRAAFDQAVALVDQARARLSGVGATAASTAGAVEAAEGRLAQAKTGPEQLDAARASVSVGEARVAQAKAALEIAGLAESYTKIVAPVRGVVSRRTVEPGQMVSPERPLLALVPPDDVWVVANFKEDQLADMRAGQRAKVKVDAYGRRVFTGKIESLAGASGARFALLPPDNASGNFVKVVQRVPVLVRLDAAIDVPLRPGMSAFVSVATND
jgi:membrane fusion protein (multidrug efflux system)